jgi:hypothetical protein
MAIDLIDGSDNVVGSLITRIADLLRCIQDGFSYEAKVKQMNGGNIQIDVRPA